MFKNKERIIIYVLIAVLAAVVIPQALDLGGAKEKEEKIVINDPAQESISKSFSLTGIDGTEYNIWDYLDEPLILTFWTTSCPDCVKVLEMLEELHLSSGDVNVLAVNVGEAKEEVEVFLREKEYNFPVLLDEKEEVSNNYMVETYPTTFALNTGGEITFKRSGTFTEESLERFLDSTRTPSIL